MTDKEITVCTECRYPFMDFLLFHAIWTGEDCKRCALKTTQEAWRRNRFSVKPRLKSDKPRYTPRNCTEKNCRMHQKGVYDPHRFAARPGDKVA